MTLNTGYYLQVYTSFWHADPVWLGAILYRYAVSAVDTFFPHLIDGGIIGDADA